MSIEAMKAAWDLEIESPAQKNVLVVLANFANQEHEAYPAVATISKYTAFSERAVRQALRALEEAGWIVRQERWHDNGRSKTTLYRLEFMTGRGGSNRPHEGAADAGGGGSRRRGEGAAGAPNPLLRSLKEPSLRDVGELPLLDPDPAQPEAARKPAKPPPIPLEPLVETWNAICGPSVARIRKLGPERERHLRRAMAEDFGNNPDEWEAFCRRVAASPFLSGRVGGTFRPDFTWIIDPDNLVRVLEGRYDNDRNRLPPLPPGQRREAPGTI